MNKMYGAVITGLLFSATLCAQTPKEYLAKAMKAYGPWEKVKTFSYRLEGEREAGAQGKTYKKGEKQVYHNRKIFDYPGKMAFEQNTNYFPGGYVFNFATVARDTAAFNWDIDRNRLGKTLNVGGPPQVKQIYNFRNLQVPYYRVEELFLSQDSMILVQAAGGTRIERHPKGKGPAIYSFNASHHLVSIESPATKEKMEYTAYTQTEGYANAGLVRASVDGKRTYEEKVSDWKYNFKTDPAQFEVPAGYSPVTRGTPLVTEIAKDIFLIEKIGGDRNVLFVNMDEYIVVIEAPLSSDVSKDVISRIRKQIPGKPIKYVFTTHFHSDHTGGLRQYAYEGATLIMTNPTADYVNDLMVAPLADDLGKQPKQMILETFIGRKEIRDAHHHIVFFEVPNSHADGMALAWFPAEKLVYQGDLLSVPLDGSLPYAISVTREMQDFLAARGVSFDRMIGHHGHHGINPEMVGKVLTNKKEAGSN